VSKKAVFKRLKELEPNFVWNDDLRKIYDNIYSNHKQKQIILIGSVGSGKTLAMQAMNINGNTFVDIPLVEILYEYERGGFERIDKYLYNEVVNNFNVRSKQPFDICIQDIGIDNTSLQFFGTKAKDLVNNILLIRHEIFKKYGKLTHITTNDTLVKLKAAYGERNLSRLQENSVLIVFPTHDYRRKIK